MVQIRTRPLGSRRTFGEEPAGGNFPNRWTDVCLKLSQGNRVGDRSSHHAIAHGAQERRAMVENGQVRKVSADA